MNKSYNHGSQLLLILFLYTVSWINFNFVHMYIVGVATSIFLYSVSLDYSLKIEPIKKISCLLVFYWRQHILYLRFF